MSADEERERLRRRIDEALERLDSGQEPPVDAEDEYEVELAKERARLKNRNRP